MIINQEQVKMSVLKFKTNSIRFINKIRFVSRAQKPQKTKS